MERGSNYDVTWTREIVMLTDILKRATRNTFTRSESNYSYLWILAQ